MRKHPFLAVTAFAAAGATLVPYTVVGSGIALAGAKVSPTDERTSSQHLTTVLATLTRNARLPRERHRDLLVAHDIRRPHHKNFDPVTGLPLRFHSRLTGRPVSASPAPVAPPVTFSPPPTTVATPTTTTPPQTAPTGGVWYQLRLCESGDNYQENTGNGYYGAYQFSLSTWNSLGLTGLPSAAPPALQDRAAAELQARDGWSPWPTCAAELGLG